MKLNCFTTNDEVVRQSWGIHQSILDKLNAYRAYYKSMYSHEPQMNRMVEEILVAFIDSDKGFVKSQKEKPSASALFR